MGAATQLEIGGAVSSGFEPVREAFVENFTRRGELGGACCVYQDGEKVVDLWGGVRDRASGEPWREDTMVVVHSATKGLAAMVAGARPLARLARLRRARLHLLARVRAERQGAHHRPPAARPPGRAVRVRRAGRPRRRRRSRSARRRSWLGSGRRGSPASGRRTTRSASASTRASCCAGSIPQHRSLGPVLRRRDRRAARPRLLHPPAGVDSRRAPRAARAAQRLEAADRACRSGSCSRR